MQGNPLLFGIRTAGHMVRRPRHTVHWISDRLRRGATPLSVGLASISWPCIDFVRRTVKPGDRVFEWGGGGSTTFFAALGCRVTTVESNEYWRDEIVKHVESELPADNRPELRFIAAENGDRAAEQQYVTSVDDGAPWDMILVDGLETPSVSRVDCVKHAVGKVRPGGIILLDDSWRPEYDGVPALLPGYRRIEFSGLGPARLGLTKTDAYIRPS
ncbi:MAG: hypothetical protein KF745_01480 [Phycisphaeraceae bacterium]|nr:hypothetical protein [Phycisphaeraceae bacterium]